MLAYLPSLYSNVGNIQSRFSQVYKIGNIDINANCVSPYFFSILHSVILVYVKLNVSG